MTAAARTTPNDKNLRVSRRSIVILPICGLAVWTILGARGAGTPVPKPRTVSPGPDAPRSDSAPPRQDLAPCFAVLLTCYRPVRIHSVHACCATGSGGSHALCHRREPERRRPRPLEGYSRSAAAPGDDGSDQAPARLRARGGADARGMVRRH